MPTIGMIELTEEQIEKMKFPRRIQVMWLRFGKHPTKKCKECQFFKAYGYHNNTFFKCSKNRITHGSGTDWRANWPACNLVDEPEEVE